MVTRYTIRSTSQNVLGWPVGEGHKPLDKCQQDVRGWLETEGEGGVRNAQGASAKSIQILINHAGIQRKRNLTKAVVLAP